MKKLFLVALTILSLASCTKWAPSPEAFELPLNNTLTPTTSGAINVYAEVYPKQVGATTVYAINVYSSRLILEEFSLVVRWGNYEYVVTMPIGNTQYRVFTNIDAPPLQHAPKAYVVGVLVTSPRYTFNPIN